MKTSANDKKNNSGNLLCKFAFSYHSMIEFKIESYDDSLSQEWDDFVGTSKNGTFILTRKFIGYHQDRFEDSSLLIYKKTKLIAVFPANSKENTIYSHQGLSYGGLILPKQIKLKDVLTVFSEILKYYNQKGFSNLLIKQTPMLYHLYPSDEIEYALFVCKAELYRRDAAICLRPSSFEPNENRKRKIKSSNSHNFQIRETDNMKPFWDEVLIPNLQISHGGIPVHSLQEIQFLKDTFPKNIKQYDIYEGNKILGGTTLFNTQKTSLAQYISATPYGKSTNALSSLFSTIITNKSVGFEYFSFGHSNENNGRVLNHTLSYWKESFGGSTITQDFYDVLTSNYVLIEELVE